VLIGCKQKDLDISSFDNWDLGLGAPLCIAGPCSVETPEQLDLTVAALVNEGIKVIRGQFGNPEPAPIVLRE
jgi:chorismate mutase